MSLPELPVLSAIRARLEVIFPDGTTDRGFVTNERAARVVFTMLYSGAMEGANVWIGPKHVYRMSDEQAARVEPESRGEYGMRAWKAGYVHIGEPWYADTSREPIRDETLRALARFGAVLEKPDVPTTSSKPRYALAADFAGLFNPALAGDNLDALAAIWQKAHLAAHALARLELVRRRMTASAGTVEVTLPQRGVRQLAPGPSAPLTKAVIEEFAPRFLYAPTVLLLSESRKKVIDVDADAMKIVGLHLKPAHVLPDVVLFDMVKDKELLVFVEVVATGGPITAERRNALAALAPSFSEERIAFVSAFVDRDSPVFRKSVGGLAWNTFAWFASEPDHVMILREAPALEVRRAFDEIREAD